MYLNIKTAKFRNFNTFKEENMRKKKVSIVLCLVFLFIGIVLLCLFFSLNISEYSSTTLGFTNLMYLPMFLFSSISSFVVSILFLIIYFIQAKSDINTRLFIFIISFIFIVFCSFNIVNVVKNYRAYDEETYFSAIENDENMQSPQKNILRFFPYYSDMEKKTNQLPYYSFSTYKMNNTVYKISQIFCNDYEKECSFTAEYFTSDKSYLSSKFISEKNIHYSKNENGESLDLSLIKSDTYGDINYDIIEQSTEKMILVFNDEYSFMFHYQDSMNILKLSTQEFVNLAFEQLDYLREYDNIKQKRKGTTL